MVAGVPQAARSMSACAAVCPKWPPAGVCVGALAGERPVAAAAGCSQIRRRRRVPRWKNRRRGGWSRQQRARLQDRQRSPFGATCDETADPGVAHSTEEEEGEAGRPSVVTGGGGAHRSSGSDRNSSRCYCFFFLLRFLAVEARWFTETGAERRRWRGGAMGLVWGLWAGGAPSTRNPFKNPRFLGLEKMIMEGSFDGCFMAAGEASHASYFPCPIH